MGLRDIEKVMKEEDPESETKEKKTTLISNHEKPQQEHNENNNSKIDSPDALKLFLDRIPINSIPGIKNSPVVELKTGDSVKEAINVLYEKKVLGAPIADAAATSGGRFMDRYIGFIDFSTIVLWCLQELQKVEDYNTGDEKSGAISIFSVLEQNPHIGQTKIGELAKSFLWEPFFPVHFEDTLFHVLLLLSKHPLQVVPVVELSNSQVIGFVTQNAVIHLLLQSSGLEWFDSIADKVSSEFRFENEENVVHVYGDHSIAEALQIMWENRVSMVAVTDRKTKSLIGSIRSSNIYLLLDNDHLFHNRKAVTVEKFIHMESNKSDNDPVIEQDLGALLSAGVLQLTNRFLPRMDSPVANKRSDTVKQVMKTMAETKSSFSFLVDVSQQATGILTSRDIIIQFGPPCMDSTIHGGGFFESVLEQSGCCIKNGTMICNH